MNWYVSWRSDPRARRVADRHYNRQHIGASGFVPPGGCLRKVFVKPDTVTHRLEDVAGKKFIVPAGWVAISFEGDWVF